MSEIYDRLDSWLEQRSRGQSAVFVGVLSALGYAVLATVLRIEPSPIAAGLSLGIMMTIVTYLFTFAHKE
ncbi:hypothetical protein C488_02970 [Natrinema pellirubrum DSM 15624]|uniref:Uncharacterized protein n=1 Tax=Natrinema pellirubrum (strain DSM 15624 / CIP 106293 / JCM 10476 / NCIMB 786 / 157) TaxID=797303 RepID=L0JJ86_NATP1|nr:hypothetical protein Natpe_0986 [Natrinema pellirubrum DSM 15624]ELY80716.1 hypothetical protein C488_02970 [Natrinema pellirubrum DSM 15624]